MRYDEQRLVAYDSEHRSAGSSLTPGPSLLIGLASGPWLSKHGGYESQWSVLAGVGARPSLDHLIRDAILLTRYVLQRFWGAGSPIFQ